MDKDRSVKVTLSSMNEVEDVKIRELLISPSQPIQIGRSSKNGGSTVADSSNCYFSSPVVSRKHAILTVNSSAEDVFITDQQSMHGTSVNGSELKRNVEHALRDGDVLTFGTGVIRGEKEHQAPIFFFEYCKPEVTPSKDNPVQEDAVEETDRKKYIVPESDISSENESEYDGVADQELLQADEATDSESKSKASTVFSSQNSMPVSMERSALELETHFSVDLPLEGKGFLECTTPDHNDEKTISTQEYIRRTDSAVVSSHAAAVQHDLEAHMEAGPPLPFSKRLEQPDSHLQLPSYPPSQHPETAIPIPSSTFDSPLLDNFSQPYFLDDDELPLCRRNTRCKNDALNNPYANQNKDDSKASDTDSFSKPWRAVSKNGSAYPEYIPSQSHVNLGDVCCASSSEKSIEQRNKGISIPPFSLMASKSAPYSSPPRPASDLNGQSINDTLPTPADVGGESTNSHLPHPNPSEPVVPLASTNNAGAATLKPKEDTRRSKTGFSIPEIVHDSPSSEVIEKKKPVCSEARRKDLKRKAEELNSVLSEPRHPGLRALDEASAPKAEATELPAEEAKTPEVTGPVSLSSNVSQQPTATNTEERPRKRVKLQLAASAIAGAVIGGLGVFATLISLPDSAFE